MAIEVIDNTFNMPRGKSRYGDLLLLTLPRLRAVSLQAEAESFYRRKLLNQGTCSHRLPKVRLVFGAAYVVLSIPILPSR